MGAEMVLVCRYCREEMSPEYTRAGRFRRACAACRASRVQPQARIGLSIRDYDLMLEKQGGGCAICGSLTNGGRAMAVDHDHVTGAIRGLLCMHCNLGLGQFRDEPALLQAAIHYLGNP